MAGNEKRKKYSCDFETTTTIPTRVWAWGWVEIGNEENRDYGNNMDDFMQWLLYCEGDCYFHNLKFDGSFIVHYLLSKTGYTWAKKKETKPGTFTTVISNMNQWYSIDIIRGYKGKKKIHTQIFDSYKKLPFSVKKIGKDFHLPVLKIEQEEEFYERPRPIGHELTQEELDYLNNDVDVVAKALEIQFEQGLTRMTSASDSMGSYQDIIGGLKKFRKMFPKFELEVNHFFQLAYKGGFTWLNEKYKEKVIDQPGMIFDVNSLYPYIMYDRLLPYGTPKYYEDEYVHDEEYPLYIQLIKTEFMVKDGHIPTIQIKRDKTGLFKSNEYQKSSKGEPVELYVTHVDLALIKEHYELIEPQYLGGWKFRGKTGMFQEFIDKWMSIKISSKGAIKQLAKLQLNSLYGKFASNPDVTGKIPTLTEKNTLKFEEGDEEYKDPIYTPMGCYITSYARDYTIRTAQSVYDRIIYCDTDSIHLIGTDIPESIQEIIDDEKLGYWAHESTFKRAKYLRQKTYVNELYKKYIIKNGEKVEVPAGVDDYEHIKLSVKCAGMSDKIKKEVTFDNFKIGFKSDKQKKPKQVPGGVVLLPTPFEIKASGSWRFM